MKAATCERLACFSNSPRIIKFEDCISESGKGANTRSGYLGKSLGDLDIMCFTAPQNGAAEQFSSALLKILSLALVKAVICQFYMAGLTTVVCISLYIQMFRC